MSNKKWRILSQNSGMGTMDLTTTLTALVRGLEENIVLINSKGEIIHATKGAEELVHSNSLEGRTIFEFLSDSVEKVRNWLAALSGSHTKDVKINILRDGKPFPARLRMAAWPSTEGDFIILVSIVDSTYIEERKRDLLRKSLTIEYLSRSRKIRDGKLYESISEILTLSSRSVNVERVNAWLYSQDNARLECIGNFDARMQEFIPQDSLPRIEMPHYFQAFETHKIILANDARTHVLTRELTDSYLVPHRIHSLMDIPIRSEGEIVGVICFEQVDREREWSLQDQKFGLIVAQMVSLALETHKRKVTEQQLEYALKEQQLLMLESNHRIRNNLSILISLMRAQLQRCQDDYHRTLVQEMLNRLLSIVHLHNLLTASDNRVDFSVYVDKLTEGLRETLSVPGKSIQIIAGVESCTISSSLAVSLGLIITEVVTNSFKYAFAEAELGCVRIELEIKQNKGFLSISDTGKGSETRTDSHGLGTTIIEGIADHINGTITTTVSGGFNFELEFLLK